jgi:uncharacterized protein YaiE (UPF0345 family)
MPQEFSGVTVVIPANIYFGGQVTSRTVKFADGSTKTLGILLPGEYEFGTAKPELMEITSGKLGVQLAGETAWTDYATGDAFNVPGNSKFKVRPTEVTDYVCSFLDE